MSRTFTALLQSLQNMHRREPNPVGIAADSAILFDHKRSQEWGRGWVCICLLAEIKFWMDKALWPLENLVRVGRWEMATPPAWGTSRSSKPRWLTPSVSHCRKVSTSVASVGKTGTFTVSILLWIGQNTKAGLLLQPYSLLSTTLLHLWSPSWVPMVLNSFSLQQWGHVAKKMLC